MTTVMVFGTFDLVHEGHRNFFSQAREHGDSLVVVVARDVTLSKFKDATKVMFTEKERLEHVQNVLLEGDIAVLGDTDDYYAVLRKYKPDIICLGYDQQSVNIDNGKIEELGLTSKLIRLKPYKPEEFKSSKLKLQRFSSGSSSSEEVSSDSSSASS